MNRIDGVRRGGGVVTAAEMISFLAREIASQPAEVAGFISRHAGAMVRLAGSLPACSYALVAARGSSDHATTYARYLWGLLARLPVASAAPSLHTLYHRPPRLNGALVVGISQSGQSPDVISVVEEGRRQGRPTLAFTNDPASPLARTADHVFDLCLTPEQAIAATKTYTTQLCAVALFGAALSGEEARLEELRRLPEAMERVLAAAAQPCQEAAGRLHDLGSLLTLARGVNLCTADELGLKLRELLCLPTFGWSAADLRHGSIVLVQPGTRALLVMPTGAAFTDMQELAQEIGARGAEVIVISDDPQAAPGALHRLPLVVSVPEWLSPATAVLPGQLLALELALARGLDPDRPRGLTDKVVKTF
jgi:glucosamine--fructose-6-phosphate aminotransferase (isomerizing)